MVMVHILLPVPLEVIFRGSPATSPLTETPLKERAPEGAGRNPSFTQAFPVSRLVSLFFFPRGHRPFASQISERGGRPCPDNHLCSGERDSGPPDSVSARGQSRA